MHVCAPVVMAVAALMTAAACAGQPASSSHLADHQRTASTQIPDEWHTYASAELGVTFRYPGRYFHVDTHERAASGHQAVALIEDTPENRDVVAGRVRTAREGPPSITLGVFAGGPEPVDLAGWIRGNKDSHYALALDAAPRPATVAGQPALTYRWDGLYAGESVAVARAGRIYLWSVTYLDAADAILRDFRDIIGTFSFM